MKKLLSIICLTVVITSMATTVHAQSTPVQFTISGHQFRTGKTYTFPSDYATLVNCSAQLRDANTTEINGATQFDDGDIFVQLLITVPGGVGKTTCSWDEHGGSGGLGMTIGGVAGPGDGIYTSVSGTISIDGYGSINQYVTGHFTASLETEGEDRTLIKGYNVSGQFKVKRTQ